MELPYQFGRYILLSKIANGGMAEVFKAKYNGERGFSKDVAVKRVLPVWSNRKDFETMLIDEAKALTHLQHQNIVQIFELGKDGEYFYISMEYVDGIDLRKLVKKAVEIGDVIPDKYGCFIAMEMLKGLEFAHRQKRDDGIYLNIVHRDISPQNLLLSYNGEVKLTDFGIAKGLHREQETTTASLKGKYAYMSPEQAMGKEIDHRSDLYSVGVILFEILTGTRLFETGNDLETIEMVRESRFPDGWEAMVSLNMRIILKKALAKDRDERYQSAADFLKDLDRYVTYKRLHTHSLELSDYLNRIFADEKNEVVFDEKVKEPRTKILNRIVTIGKSKMAGSSIIGKRYAMICVAIMPLLVGSILTPEKRGDSILVKNLLHKVQKVAEEVLPEKVSERPKTPKISPIQEGLINIDSAPSGVVGTLEYSDIKKSFTTPFIFRVPDVGMMSETKVSLTRKGYKSVVDTFSLTMEDPIFSRVYNLKEDEPARISIQARPWGYVYIPGVISKRESPVNGVRLKPGRYKVKVHYSPTNTWAQASVNVSPGQTRRCLADFTKGNKITCR